MKRDENSVGKEVKRMFIYTLYLYFSSAISTGYPSRYIGLEQSVYVIMSHNFYHNNSISHKLTPISQRGRQTPVINK